MKKVISLNGSWKLYYYDPEEAGLLPEEVTDPSELQRLSKEGVIHKITAAVPGNVELDLSRAGVIPEDLFMGMTPKENEKWESYDFIYVRSFVTPEDLGEGDSVTLRFDGVDCFAEYYVNGSQVFYSENAFMTHEFDITDFLSEDRNTLLVHIYSTMRQAFSYEVSGAKIGKKTLQTHIRKPAHSFGWDIFPRCVSAGLTRDAALVIDDGIYLNDVTYHVADLDRTEAMLAFSVDAEIPYSVLKERNASVRIQGVCGESGFETEIPLDVYRTSKVEVHVKSPLLWWPEGYGDAHIYDTTAELLIDGEVCDTKKFNVGIRSVELLRTETMLEKDHCFQFVVNGVPVLLNGSNWVPLSPYHSMDKDRYQKVLPFFTDTHSNIVRVWGGGVYEQEAFYDYCDRHGICVWQDFMIACIPVDQDQENLEKLRAEFTWAVRTLRNHPAIILWAGDNEIDESMSFMGQDPGGNIVNRKLLPEVLALEDPYREYLPSSPYIPAGFGEKYKNQDDIFVERHLWGARDYFKADFYRNSKAHFVSECGYQGCPSVSSIQKFIDKDCVWPIFNDEWTLHSSDQDNNPHRVHLTWKQVQQLFAFEPQNPEDFSKASQISQAEAKKFFIERIRIHKPYTSGIIWWNMMDGWPQLSDAVVDFFFEKKLAYDYIKRSQEPVCLMLDELKNWNYTLYACNDTLEEKEGSYEVLDIDTGDVLASGSFFLEKNENRAVGKVPLFYSDKKFLVIRWNIGGKTYYNHYLAGAVPFDFGTYCHWLDRFNEIIREA